MFILFTPGGNLFCLLFAKKNIFFIHIDIYIRNPFITEINKWIDGVASMWTLIYRFDTIIAINLDKWLQVKNFNNTWVFIKIMNLTGFTNFIIIINILCIKSITIDYILVLTKFSINWFVLCVMVHIAVFCVSRCSWKKKFIALFIVYFTKTY